MILIVCCCNKQPTLCDETEFKRIQTSIIYFKNLTFLCVEACPLWDLKKNAISYADKISDPKLLFPLACNLSQIHWNVVNIKVEL